MRVVIRKYLGWGVSLVFLGPVLRAIEWRSFFESLAHLRWLGKTVRAQVIGQTAGIRRSTTLSNIIVERILDDFAVVLILFAGAAGDWAQTE